MILIVTCLSKWIVKNTYSLNVAMIFWGLRERCSFIAARGVQVQRGSMFNLLVCQGWEPPYCWEQGWAFALPAVAWCPTR